jgi:uncharacterized damage-inducible protein DinB
MRTCILVIAAAILVASDAAAQTATAGKGPVSDAIRSAWNNAKRNIKDSAAQMPEDAFAFRPVDTVRTFGQIIGHVAGANYVFCSSATGDKTERAEDAIEKTAKTKADLVKALDDSLAYCDAAFNALTDASAAETVDLPFGMGKGARAVALLGNTGHLNEHYGNLVTYFRIKGMVPPSSARSR